MKSVQKKLLRLRDALADALLPPPNVTVSQWARDRFRLSSDYGPSSGHFEPYPYQIEPLDVLSPTNPADTMVLMCGAQMMKTLIMMILLGYVVDVDPGPVLIVQPTESDADTFSKERIAPMLRDIPCVAAKMLGEEGSRKSGNTILQKRFRGGSVSLTGAVSPRGLRRRSVRYLLLDEVDGYETTDDGDPLPLAAARTSKFWNRKIVLCSTPTFEGRSRIGKAFEDSDRRYYFVPCPFCAHMQTLVWEGVRWGYVETTADGRPDTNGRYIVPEDAHYLCAECGEFIPHHRKFEMLRAGGWRATNPEGKFPGYTISRLYAPDWPWGKVVTDPHEGWLQAKDDQSRVQTFRNNVLALTFREPGEAPPDYEKLRARAVLEDSYRLGQVPNEVGFLNIGCDVQQSWIEGYVWGWGYAKQRWCIDHFRVEKGPHDPTAWSDLDEILNSVYTRTDGTVLPITRFCIDTGYQGQHGTPVYAWARRHGASRVLAIDGRNSGPPLASPTLVDVMISGRKVKHGAKLWGTNVSQWKSELYAQLNTPAPGPDEPKPAGWVNFPSDLPEEFYKQLTSEQFVLSIVRGQRHYHWEGIEGRRHESLDCANYARAGAYQRTNSDRRWNDDRWWRSLVSGRLSAPPPRPAAAPVIQAPAAPPVQQVAQATPQRSSGGWFGNSGRGWFDR